MNTISAILTVVIGVGLAIQVRRHGKPMALIALQLLLVFVGSWALWQLDQNDKELAKTQADLVKTQQHLEQERSVRVAVQAEINRYVCAENNKQDRTLAALVDVSSGSGNSFGEGVDLGQLTPFDVEVLQTISKVQRLSEDRPDALQAVFDRTLAQLRAESPCEAIVDAFLEASDTDDLKEIRRVLRSQEQREKQAHSNGGPSKKKKEGR